MMNIIHTRMLAADATDAADDDMDDEEIVCAEDASSEEGSAEEGFRTATAPSLAAGAADATGAADDDIDDEEHVYAEEESSEEGSAEEGLDRTRDVQVRHLAGSPRPHALLTPSDAFTRLLTPSHACLLWV